jgi:hypothetical protein
MKKGWLLLALPACVLLHACETPLFSAGDCHLMVDTERQRCERANATNEKAVADRYHQNKTAEKQPIPLRREERQRDSKEDTWIP